MMMNNRAPTQTRDVGEMGEAAFRGWCQRQGLSVQQSKPDRMGWDLFVEYEPEVVATIARDRQHTLKSAFVQVKSSDHAGNSVRAKLSALKRLADKVDPAVILFLEFEGKSDPVRGRLLCIGQREISAILRRMRVAESEGRLDFQNIDLSLSLENAVEITPDGSQIADELYSAIPDDMTAHAAEKQRWRETCGNDHIAGSFSIQGQDGQEALVDLFIGKRKSLIVDRFVVKKSRFGITLPSETTEHLRSEISISTTGRDVMMRAWDHERFLCVELAALFLAAPIRNIPDEMKKVRIYNDFIECVISFTQNIEFQINIPHDKVYDISELAQILKFAVLLSLPKSHLEVEITPDITIPIGTPLMNVTLQRWANIAAFAELIARATGANLQQRIRVSMDELVYAFQSCEKLFLAATQLDCAFKFTVDRPVPKGAPSNGELFFPFWVPFTDLTYQSIIRTPIKVNTIRGMKFRLEASSPSCIEHSIIPTRNFDLDRLNSRVDFHSRVGSRQAFTMKPRPRLPGLTILAPQPWP